MTVVSERVSLETRSVSDANQAVGVIDAFPRVDGELLQLRTMIHEDLHNIRLSFVFGAVKSNASSVGLSIRIGAVCFVFADFSEGGQGAAHVS